MITVVFSQEQGTLRDIETAIMSSLSGPFTSTPSEDNQFEFRFAMKLNGTSVTVNYGREYNL